MTEFEVALDVRPADRGLRLVYADWLHEQGDEDWAAFLRWTAATRRVPAFDVDTEHETPWMWTESGWKDHRGMAFAAATRAAYLPLSLLGGLPKLSDPGLEDDPLMTADEWRLAEGWMYWNDPGERDAFFRTRRSAEAALFAAWVAAGKPEGLS